MLIGCLSSPSSHECTPHPPSEHQKVGLLQMLVTEVRHNLLNPLGSTNIAIAGGRPPIFKRKMETSSSQVHFPSYVGGSRSVNTVTKMQPEKLAVPLRNEGSFIPITIHGFYSLIVVTKGHPEYLRYKSPNKNRLF